MAGDTAAFEHEPVMLAEVVDAFAPVPPGTVLDATLGGGGHSEALLERYGAMTVLGLDQDADALAAARHRLARFGDRVTTVHGRFDRLPEVLREQGVDELSGALFDLGVSSPQLDRADRGFSYRNDGPLDMRMDRSQPLTAASSVVVWSGRAATMARAIRAA